MLAKETHDIAIRSAPPLIITEEELDWMLDQFEAVLDAATPPTSPGQAAIAVTIEFSPSTSGEQWLQIGTASLAGIIAVIRIRRSTSAEDLLRRGHHARLLLSPSLRGLPAVLDADR